MWNKIWWLKGLFVFLVIQTGTSTKIYAQKKWDGGGNDTLWSNPLNWYPDGVPTAIDTVVLNNQWIPHSYHVYFPTGLVTSHALSLSIEPSSSYLISVTLPNTNTGVPGLILYAGDTALTLNNRSIFYNASGAAAGNAIQLTGKVMIKNGGKYVHQTQRGNALIIANLVASTETERGVFELNVPGNSAYTLSASGRNFGSLVLSGQHSSRKTYTSSGINQLTIRGDLLINEQATFSSSLTHNITVSGDMTIKGRLYINPISSDTVGRCLVTNGTNNTIEISGQLNQGPHFRKWLFAGNYQLLYSTLNIDHAEGKIQVQSSSTVDLGNSMIRGAGEFIADSNSSFLSSAICIIGSDTAANIQTERLNLHPAINFTCYGSKTQTTGNRFPAMINKLKIEKPLGNLFLSKSIILSDSLLFKNGKLISIDTSSICILRYCNIGNEKSYFTGRIIHLSTSPDLFFPLGKGDLFAPIEITRQTEAGQTYEIAVDSLSPTLLTYSTLSPIQQLSNSVYWTIKIHQESKLKEQAQLIFKKQAYGQSDCIASLDNLTTQWKLAVGFTSNESQLIASIDSSSTQLFALGKLYPTVLPLSAIKLQKFKNEQEITLTWTVDDDENAVFYLIEYSKNGINFQTSDTITSIKKMGRCTYTKKIKPVHTNCFFRIKGIDIDGRGIISNIIALQQQPEKVQLFPNPSRDVLYLQTNESIKKLSLLYPHGEMKPVLYEVNREIHTINVKELKAGYYILVIDYSNRRTTLPFVKQ